MIQLRHCYFDIKQQTLTKACCLFFLLKVVFLFCFFLGKVLVDSVAVIICFVSVIRVFIVSLFEFIFKRLSEIICVILMIFVTMLEHVARIEMLIMLMVTRVLEKLPVHSSIKAFQNDQNTMCLVSKYLFKRIPMNCDVMQDRIMGSETAQCCNRMRSFGKF